MKSFQRALSKCAFSFVGNPIHDLLMIAVTDGLTEYMKFYEDHKEYLQKMGLEHTKLMKKMRKIGRASCRERV